VDPSFAPQREAQELRTGVVVNLRTLSLWQIDLFPWYVFAAYWAITSLRVNRTKAREKSADRLATLVVVVVAFSLLFKQWVRVGPLRLRFVPDQAWIAWVGIALSFLGVAVSIWARYCLGVYWSARVTLKETGMLLASMGTALVGRELGGILAVVLLLAAHSRKAVREEGLLATEFGEEYAAYRRSTGFLFPRLSGKIGMDTPAGHS
jgi:protein-S-isoprenylcysteine O-methyltransferase Ste14